MFWELIDRESEHETDFVGNQTQGPSQAAHLYYGALCAQVCLFHLYKRTRFYG